MPRWRQLEDELPPLPEEEADIVWQHLRADKLHALVSDEGSRWSSAMREARVGSPPSTGT